MFLEEPVSASASHWSIENRALLLPFPPLLCGLAEGGTGKPLAAKVK